MNPKIPDDCRELTINRKMQNVFLKKNVNRVDSNDEQVHHITP